MAVDPRYEPIARAAKALDPAHKPGKSFAGILTEELREIRDLRARRHQPVGALNQDQNTNGTDEEKADRAIAGAHDSLLTGLAFSGGGIRSATFNLGVLQALADLDLLQAFDYLSTVSGGGYIGSWLAAWINRRGLVDVAHDLRTDRVENPDHQEAEEIRFLREYSNYLTPRLGFFSLDTWNMVATYLRNTLLNLTILILAMGSILLLPHAGLALEPLANSSAQWAVEWAGAFLFLMVVFIGVNMAPSIFAPQPHVSFACFTEPIYARLAGAAMLPAGWLLSVWLLRPGGAASAWTNGDWIARGGFACFGLWLLSSLIAGIAGQASWRFGGNPKQDLRRCRAVTAVAVVILLSVAWFGISFSQEWLLENITLPRLLWLAAALTVLIAVMTKQNRDAKGSPAFQEFSATLFAAVFAGALGGLMLKGIISLLNALGGRNWGSIHVLVLGTPMIVTALLLVATVHVGLMGVMLSNPKREWWSRIGGWILVLSITWIIVCGLSLYAGPFPHAYNSKLWERFVRWGLTPAWIFSTLAGVLAGKSKSTGSDQNPILERLVSFTPYIFVVGLLAGVSYALSAIFTKLAEQGWAPVKMGCLFMSPLCFRDGLQAFPPAAPGASAYEWLQCHPALWIVSASSLLMLVAWTLACRVDINEFSMHLFYRNRLVKCYLGASNVRDRWAHPFTGFDPKDDIKLSTLRAEKGYSGPLPIINTTLNLVQGGYLAWQERKAESFIFTPLNCGYDVWMERLRMSDECYGYRPADEYGFPDGGFYLGGALSISGAAASPNMGYHSNPAMAFLMTVFDVRLGWWAGNPRKGKWQEGSPLVGFGYLLNELLENTNDESNYVYLSDGGHFENLGVYELIKRRCAFIVACDAGADPAYGFGDLGAAIRKCREDMGVEITIKTEGIFPKAQGDWKLSQYHYAVGEIDYRNVDPAPAQGHEENRLGVFVYIKASLTGDEPADVQNYKTEHPAFPHETTADQWFTESQFESYRRLGQHVANTVFDKSWNTGRVQLSPEQRRNFPPDSGAQELLEHIRGY